jgi:hypothetical protein
LSESAVFLTDISFGICLTSTHLSPSSIFSGYFPVNVNSEKKGQKWKKQKCLSIFNFL